MTPLYLDGLATPLAVHGEGPALRIRKVHTADQLVPLRRLSRIVVRGSVTWADGALETCLVRGVSLAFLDGMGRSLGLCLPDAVPRDDLEALIDEALLLDRFAEVKESWLGAAERAAILRCLGRLPIVAGDLRPQRFARRLLTAIDEAAAPIAAEVLLARIDALVLAMVGDRLHAAGAGARFQGADPEFDLRRDLARLLAWETRPMALRLATYLARHAARHLDERALQRRIVAQFEALSPALDKAFTRELGGFKRVLRAALL